MDVPEAADAASSVLASVSDAVITRESFLETLVTGVVAGGHVLLEDVPGTGKTLTARSLATALGLEFSRVQFTPDLLPADVTGSYVFDERDRSFEFRRGPIFANVVLADEINRAPPKTQAALLEAMAEEQVTVDGTTHQLPDPFIVLATMNPVEQEGTFPLPEAQRDRFWLKTSIGYPEPDREQELLDRRAERETSTPAAWGVLTPDSVRELQAAAEDVRVDPDLRAYMTAVVQATRRHDAVEVGVSPRGLQRLFELSRARAVVEGRGYVVPGDVERVGVPALAHRLVLTPEARVGATEPATVIEAALEGTPTPTVSG
ncbi:AAA family ATPase [Natronomonas salina]|uniref:AAA family ATPase n=1 Tax=Natronomonas salina TaxID=1710540 RepID=UPI0015B7178F|nr:MoxR family ATPase [Natronomonas salina]QLD89321.1 AAA family ATPase [Natronomonas salina]